MANLAKLDFVALDITGKNYLTWVVDTKIHLDAGNLRETINEENSASSQDQAKAMIFIHRHLDEGLKSTHFAYCHFDETIFPSLRGENIVPEEQQELTWVVPTLSHFDPRSTQCENEVKMIVHLQSISNQMRDTFNDAMKVTKSHIPAANAPAKIDVPVGQNKVVANDSSNARLKRGRPQVQKFNPSQEKDKGTTESK
ncbi:uncharacterized protein [Malus domestica]|uniref:uncharacterized protein n=1 Tax=Malus domestica TaxID=3750 RepID=UPI0039755837